MEMEWDRNEMENMYLKSQESADSYWILISLQNIFSHRRVIVLSSSIMPEKKYIIPVFKCSMVFQAHLCRGTFTP